MYNTLFKPPNSRHNISLSSSKISLTLTTSISPVTKGYISKKRESPDEGPQIQVYQNEIHIPRWENFEQKDFKKALNEFTRNVNLYEIKGSKSLSISFLE